MIHNILAQLTIILGLLSSLLANMEEPKFGAATVTDIINQKKTEQEEYFVLQKKYKYNARQTCQTYECEVHEYKTPVKEQGFQLFLISKEGYLTKKRSIGFGPEAVSRTYDWIIIEDDTPLASTTP